MAITVSYNRYITVYKRYKNAYKNYISVMFNMIMNKDTINVVTREGKTDKWKRTYVWTYPLLCNLIKDQNYSNNINYFSDKTNYFEFKFNNKDLKFYGIKEGNGDFVGIFINNEYEFLNPNECAVIDIGANIGDSAIYMIMNNAKKVVSLEPYPYSYNLALKNIELNNLKDRITLINGGYGKDSIIKIDENKITDAGTDLVFSNEGKEIQLYSLKKIIKDFNLDGDLLLKMDCEGCEYNLLNEDSETLKKFKRIQIEYHYGYEKLVDKLKECNFKIEYTKQRKSYNPSASDPNMIVGFIYAEKL